MVDAHTAERKLRHKIMSCRSALAASTPLTMWSRAVVDVTARRVSKIGVIGLPIRPEMRLKYPADWPEISERIRHSRAEGRCECRGECGQRLEHLATDDRCYNVDGMPAYFSGAKVVLTAAHLDRTPEHSEDENLRAFCQSCHLWYDRDHHAQTRRETRAKALADQMEGLF